MSRKSSPILPLVSLLGVLVATPGVASAAESVDLSDRDVKVASLSGDDVLSGAVPADMVLGAESADRVAVYLEEQARQGDYIDEQQVTTSQVRNQITGADIEILWADGLVPTEVNLSQVDLDDGSSQEGFGVGMGQDPDSPNEKRTHSSGMGYSPGTPNGMTLHSNDCWNAYFEPTYDTNAGNHHHMVSCYQKFEANNSSDWAYNRWGLWHTEQPSSNFRAGVVIDYTLRSRPWSGLESDFQGTNDYAPRFPSSSCTPGMEVELSYGGAGVTIPFQNCEFESIFPNPTQNSMGIMWSGDSTSQLGLQFGQHVTAATSTTVPVWADYNWAEVQDCPRVSGVVVCGPTSPTFAYAHADSGW